MWKSIGLNYLSDTVFVHWYEPHKGKPNVEKWNAEPGKRGRGAITDQTLQFSVHPISVPIRESMHDCEMRRVSSYMVSWIPTDTCLPDAAYFGPHHSN
jgi:hypothetical protein